MEEGAKEAMWGKHLVLDCSACDPRAVRDGEAIREFCGDLGASIGMVAYEEPIVEHFATDLPEASGYSLMHLTEPFSVTGYFRDASGDAYLDIFSCESFDPEVVIEVVRRHFRPKLIRRRDPYRDASQAVDETFGERVGSSRKSGTKYLTRDVGVISGSEVKPAGEVGRERMALRARKTAITLLVASSFFCLIPALAMLAGYLPYTLGPSVALLAASIAGFVASFLESKKGCDYLAW